MLGALFVLLALLFVFMLLVGIMPQKCLYDWDAPLNLVLYQEPQNRYPDQFVNLWVDKPWRTDGKRIPCRWEVYDAEQPVEDRTLILYSHGNNENLIYCGEFMRQLSQSLHLDAVCWDYSGYGLNDPDRFERSADGVNLSLKTVLDHLVEKEGYRLPHIYLWGYSLGSGPSLLIASRLCQAGTPPQGVILFGAYASIKMVVADHTNENIANLFSERWNSAQNIKHVTCPVLILHGQSDGLIKIKHAEKLKKAQPNAKLVVLPNVGHTTFSWGDSIHEVQKWMTDLSP